MEQASFTFKTYQIKQFSFNIDNISNEKTSVKIDPTGEFISGKNTFVLSFQFFAFDKKKGFENNFVNCLMRAEFIFSEEIKSIEDIPSYFYANSIAIVFPYLRSFISSLTIQANMNPVILPTMNLTSLSGTLKDNVIVK